MLNNNRLLHVFNTLKTDGIPRRKVGKSHIDGSVHFRLETDEKVMLGAPD